MFLITKVEDSVKDLLMAFKYVWRTLYILVVVTVLSMLYMVVWEHAGFARFRALTVGTLLKTAYDLDPKGTELLSDNTSSSSSQTLLATTLAQDSVETPMPLLFRKDFKAMPQWDFEDVYALDAQPGQTTCQASLRTSVSLNFNQKFIPNIRLFMNNESIDLKEWNRLAHFNNPFGFMEYNYNEIMPVLRLIPKHSEPFHLRSAGDGCVRCAVVGTGGILNGSGMGREIDAHDHVFRMNGALTDGYEDDVGNKTTVYVHTAHSIRTSLYIFKKYGFKEVPHDEGIQYVMIPEGLRDFQWMRGLLTRQQVTDGPYKNLQPWTYYAGTFNKSQFHVLHPDFLRYVRNRFLKSVSLSRSWWAIVRPTNGAFTLFLALQTCDVVDAYGFITDDYNNYPTYYFQRHSKSQFIFYGNHDYKLELKTWKQLNNETVINLYQRLENKKTLNIKR